MNGRVRVSVALLAVLALLPLVGCGASGSSAEPTESTEETQQEQQTGIANPFVDCISASEAAKLAGFEITFPEAVPGYSERIYQAIEGEMVQCIYRSGDNRVIIRKAVGSEDISGDYNEYATVMNGNVNGIDVIEKGDGSLLYVATWTRDGYTYAIDADAGLDISVIEGLVASTM